MMIGRRRQGQNGLWHASRHERPASARVLTQDLRRAVAMGAGFVLCAVAMAVLVAPVLSGRTAQLPVPVLEELSVRLADVPSRGRDRGDGSLRRSARGPAPATRERSASPVTAPARSVTPSEAGPLGRGGAVALVRAAGRDGGLPAPVSLTADADHDGLPTYWEESFGSDPEVSDAVEDLDADGLTNATEFHAHSLPRRADTNSDGLLDGGDDPDGDGLVNATEQAAATDPGAIDADHDGVPDPSADADGDGASNLAEQSAQTDPAAPDSVPSPEPVPEPVEPAPPELPPDTIGAPVPRPPAAAGPPRAGDAP